VKTFLSCVLFSTLCWASGVFAQGGDGWGLEQLMSDLARAEKSTAQFTEKKYMKVLKTPIESSGTLSFEAPDRMIKRTLKPKPETMTVDADRLILERQGRTRTLRLQDYPVLWAFIESIRATLKGDLDTLTRFYNVELRGMSQRWSLAMKPRDAKMSRVISSIEIDGADGKVKTVKVQEAQGDRSVMTITEGN
jgi:outer membrane lipoprotein-sorting protein